MTNEHIFCQLSYPLDSKNQFSIINCHQRPKVNEFDITVVE